jgi:tetratricopeptide (TPR) repeat protein
MCDGDVVEEDLARKMLGLRLQALYVLNQLGDSHQQAVLIGELLIKDFTRTLGPRHPGTVMAQSNLATAYGAAGRNTDAVTLYEQALAVCDEVADASHLITLRMRNNLALAYLEAGRAADAIPLHQQTLTDLERVLGPDHPAPRARGTTSPPPITKLAETLRPPRYLK